MLQKIGIDDIIQINPSYSWSPAERDELKWKTIPRATAIRVYQKYFADFVIFGYSTEDVIPYINASDPDLGKKLHRNFRDFAVVLKYLLYLQKCPDIVGRVIQGFTSMLEGQPNFLN